MSATPPPLLLPKEPSGAEVMFPNLGPASSTASNPSPPASSTTPTPLHHNYSSPTRDDATSSAAEDTPLLPPHVCSGSGGSSLDGGSVTTTPPSARRGYGTAGNPLAPSAVAAGGSAPPAAAAAATLPSPHQHPRGGAPPPPPPFAGADAFSPLPDSSPHAAAAAATAPAEEAAGCVFGLCCLPAGWFSGVRWAVGGAVLWWALGDPSCYLGRLSDDAAAAAAAASPCEGGLAVEGVVFLYFLWRLVCRAVGWRESTGFREAGAGAAAAAAECPDDTPSSANSIDDAIDASFGRYGRFAQGGSAGLHLRPNLNPHAKKRKPAGSGDSDSDEEDAEAEADAESVSLLWVAAAFAHVVLRVAALRLLHPAEVAAALATSGFLARAATLRRGDVLALLLLGSLFVSHIVRQQVDVTPAPVALPVGEAGVAAAAPTTTAAGIRRPPSPQERLVGLALALLSAFLLCLLRRPPGEAWFQFVGPQRCRRNRRRRRRRRRRLSVEWWRDEASSSSADPAFPFVRLRTADVVLAVGSGLWVLHGACALAAEAKEPLSAVVRRVFLGGGGGGMPTAALAVVAAATLCLTRVPYAATWVETFVALPLQWGVLGVPFEPVSVMGACFFVAAQTAYSDRGDLADDDDARFAHDAECPSPRDGCSKPVDARFRLTPGCE